MYIRAALLALICPVFVAAQVFNVHSLDFFYDTVNSGNYTVVKYYTNWCSHCKRLAPVFEELSEAYANSNVTFLEVECETFGSTICHRLPGFPMVEVIRPVKITTEDKEEASVSGGAPPHSLWARFKTFLSRSHNPAWHLDLDRVAEFEGSRELPNLTKFVNQVIKDHEENELIDKVLGGEACGLDLQCDNTREYVENIQDLTLENDKLRSIMQNNDAPHLQTHNIPFKLKIVERLLQRDQPHDEL
ncbi:LAMI_0B06920g1_1 [Lachancea mirantina]|uniref:LAMI_0B06920g1_1 n=1 Tax=Lachancea mirantina TaxID=1230905 RepID=A0A1G4IWV0_9SACH|nr:LAMI_0B06920g1_1 [Lachancea mirantina]